MVEKHSDSTRVRKLKRTFSSKKNISTHFDNTKKSSSVMGALEYILFGVLVLANFALGLYFSFHKRGLRAVSNYAALEVFLGSRTLMILPLAASTVASFISSIGLVALPSHYYVYGWHVMWGSITPLVVLPLATHVFVPVIYGLDVTSIFQVSGTLYSEKSPPPRPQHWTPRPSDAAPDDAAAAAGTPADMEIEVDGIEISLDEWTDDSWTPPQGFRAQAKRHQALKQQAQLKDAQASKAPQSRDISNAVKMVQPVQVPIPQESINAELKAQIKNRMIKLHSACRSIESASEPP
ncbi:hypothetical protein MTO96_028691 [Rhipicephalus appendiculatus]